MNRKENLGTSYILNRGFTGSRSCPSLESCNTLFSAPETNTRNYASHGQAFRQQPQHSGYQNSLLNFPGPTAQLMQSGIPQYLDCQTTSRKLLQPNFESYGKIQDRLGISMMTNWEAGNIRREENMQSKNNAELAHSNSDMEKILNSSWGELAGFRSKGEHHYPNSWTGSTAVCKNMQSEGAEASKQRIRWTHELHMQFVEAVNSLGGAMKATPKGILGLMKSQGLTMFHIKSHLQKYRSAKHIPDFVEGRRGTINRDKMLMPIPKGDGGFQISEALRMQMEVQKSLHEHLEFQRKLQKRLEDHANYLQKMFDQQKMSYSSFERHNSDKAVDSSVADCSSTGGYCDHV